MSEQRKPVYYDGTEHKHQSTYHGRFMYDVSHLTAEDLKYPMSHLLGGFYIVLNETEFTFSTNFANEQYDLLKHDMANTQNMIVIHQREPFRPIYFYNNMHWKTGINTLLFTAEKHTPLWHIGKKLLYTERFTEKNWYPVAAKPLDELLTLLYSHIDPELKELFDYDIFKELPTEIIQTLLEERK